MEALTQDNFAEDVFKTELALTATDFWWWAPNYVITEDEENKTKRAFPTAEAFPYLKELVDDIDANTMLCIHKSRRLLITWTIILRFLHKTMFSGTGIPGTADAFRGALLSIDEDTVKDAFGHLYGVYDRFPKWLQNLNPIKSRTKMKIEFSLGGIIQGFSLKQSGPRAYGFSEMLFDEMAFQMFARKTWQGAAPTLGKEGKMIAVSTSNGQGNFFYRMYSNKKNEFPEVFRKYIPWTANPEHDQKWFENMAARLDREGIERELEGSFLVQAGEGVFRDKFLEHVHVIDDKPKADKHRIAYMWWDMGYHFPACGMGQVNPQDQLIVFESVTGSSESIYDFGKRIKEARMSNFPEGTRFIHFVPLDARKKYSGGESKLGHVSDFDALFNPNKGIFGGEQAYRGKVEISARLNGVRQMLKLRADGLPGVLMHRNGCVDLVDGFKGGYAFPDADFISNHPDQADQPVKNEWSHEMDALQQFATGYEYVSGLGKRDPEQQEEDTFIGHGIGT